MPEIGPPLATSVGSSPDGAGGLPSAFLGNGHTTRGSTEAVATPAFTVKNAALIADPNLGKGPGGSISRTGALPPVPPTPDPKTYKHKGTSW